MAAVDIEELHRAHAFAPAEATALAAAWLGWYDAGHRKMPWRDESSADERAALGAEARAQWAYRVWVSEVMLQQTQVDRVIPYFERWMLRFPTMCALAAASIDDVRTAWTGLGYYRRAAFLLEGAQQIVSHGDGLPPTTAAGWAEVKGVGPYTAGAIASIVYGQHTPLVDGNVIRVVARLRAVGSNPKAPASVKLWWRLAHELVDARRPGDLNQAMMELGATVCTKAAPACDRCPLTAHCRAYKEAKGATGAELAKAIVQYPAVAPKPDKREVDYAVCVLQRVPAEHGRGSAAELWAAGEFYLLKRPESASGQNGKLLAGLWELPTAELDDDGDGDDGADARLARAVDAVLRAQGVWGVGGAEEGGVVCRHLVSVDKLSGEPRPLVQTFSHLKHRLLVEWLVVQAPAAARAPTAGAAEGVWLSEADIATKGASSAVAKAIDCARAFATRAPGAAAPARPARAKTDRAKRKLAPVPPSQGIAKFFKGTADSGSASDREGAAATDTP